MPEQPTIIIQNANQQNNNGCGGTGCATGCGIIILIGVLLWPISMTFSALDGEASSWWIPVGIFLTILEVVLIGSVGFAYLDKQFGWGYTDGSRAAEQSPSGNTVAPEDLAGDESNYGVPKEPTEKPQAENRGKLGRPVPHPDDPPKPRPVAQPIKGIDQRVDLPGGSPQAPRDGVQERLRRIKSLLDEDLITREEYETKRAEILRDV